MSDKSKSDRERIMCKHQQIVGTQLSKHSKVLQTRLDVRYPVDYEGEVSNSHMSTLFDYVERALDSKRYSGGHKVDAKHIAVAEQSSAEHPHFHAIMVVNGNAIQKEDVIFKLADKYWKSILKTERDGLVHHCNKDKRGNYHKNGIMVKRGQPDEQERLEECREQARYLAKDRGKENKLKGTWPCLASRVSSREK